MVIVDSEVNLALNQEQSRYAKAVLKEAPLTTLVSGDETFSEALGKRFSAGKPLDLVAKDIAETHLRQISETDPTYQAVQAVAHLGFDASLSSHQQLMESLATSSPKPELALLVRAIRIIRRKQASLTDLFSGGFFILFI